jgi:DNA-binding NarL/FixJ family response regulator
VSSEQVSIRILVVDDHPIIRQGIGALVGTQSDMILVAEASNGRDAIQQFRAHRPDITLMDLQMPEMNGLDALVAIRAEFPNARIIVLTTYSGDAQILRALKSGAQGYLLKNTFDKLVDTIRAVHLGRKQIAPEIAAELADHAADDELSSREIDVLRLVGAGNANKQIADKLAIGETTVKNHISNILSKLGANDRAHAVTIGLQRGIIELEAHER